MRLINLWESIKVRETDPLWAARLRLLYLVPLLVAAYPVIIVVEGARMVGTPFTIATDVAQVWKKGANA